MTTAGPVATQPGAPPAAAPSRVRDTGSDSGSASAGESDNGFDDVMSKLQRKDPHHAGNAVAGSSRPGERGRFPLRGAEDQPAPPDDASSDAADADALADGDLATSLAPLPDASTAQGQATAAIANDLAAAIAAANTVQPSAAAAPGAPAASATARPDPMATAKAVLDAKMSAADASAATNATNAANAASASPAGAGTDQVLARFAAAGTAAAGDKPQPSDASSDPATATDSSPPVAADATPAPRSIKISAAERPKASVLRQETHFPPAAPPSPSPSPSTTADAQAGSLPPSGEASPTEPLAGTTVSGGTLPPPSPPPTQQIADRIFAEAAAATQSADPPGATPDQPATKLALRVLHIQLQPADLGAVTVRMELRDSELTLHVEADRRETADLIRSDQDALSKVLRSAGYGVDTGSIRVAEPDRTLAAQSTGQQGAQTNLQSFAQSQSGTSERQAQEQRGHPRPSGGEASPQSGRNDTHETVDDRAGRGLYV